MQVLITEEAQGQFEGLEPEQQGRVLKVVQRLRSWPNVSGAKPLRHEWSGYFRIRTGDWRVVFRPQGGVAEIIQIAHKNDAYGG